MQTAWQTWEVSADTSTTAIYSMAIRFEFKRDCLMMLCRQCINVYKNTGIHRETTVICRHHITATATADRRAGRPVFCNNCNRIEKPRGPKWVCRDALLRLLCDHCLEYHDAHGIYRDSHMGRVDERNEELLALRQLALDVECDNCHKIEGPHLVALEYCRVDEPSLKILCSGCMRTVQRSRQDG